MLYFYFYGKHQCAKVVVELIQLSARSIYHVKHFIIHTYKPNTNADSNIAYYYIYSDKVAQFI